MRLASATSVLLLVVLATLAPNCVAGWNGQTAADCSRAGVHRICVGQKVDASRGSCHRALKSQPNSCGLRSFVQMQFASFRSTGLTRLLLRSVGSVFPGRPAIFASSIGSPQTDRGPPLS